MRYISQMKHPSEVVSSTVYAKAFLPTREATCRVAFYDAKKDDYISKIPISLAAEVKVNPTEKRFSIFD